MRTIFSGPVLLRLLLVQIGPVKNLLFNKFTGSYRSERSTRELEKEVRRNWQTVFIKT